MTDKTTENFTGSLTENFSILKHSMLFNENYSSNNRNCMTVLQDVAEKIVFQDAQSFHWNCILTSMERVEGDMSRWFVTTKFLTALL
jgi:hypothetical protein